MAYFPQAYPDPSLMLCQQIEHYFSENNLIRDIYLRQRMDVEGWVPCAMLFDFPRVKQMCYGIEFLMAACEHSTLIEVNTEHEKIRLRQGWKKWLYPGQDGNMGVPLYTKFPRAPSPMMLQQQQQQVQYAKNSPEVIQVDSSSSSSSSSDNESEPASPASSAPPTPSRASLKVSLSADAAEWKPTFA